MKTDDLVVLDRNCHKSIEQGLMLTGARAGVPGADAQPLRHHRPDPASEMDPKAIQAKAKASPLTQEGRGDRSPSTRWSRTAPTTGCATTPTRVEALLGKIVRPHPLRRGLVRLRALQPDVSRTTSRCAATRRHARRARRCSPRTRRTSCWRRFRRPPTSTCATAAARSTTTASTQAYMMHTTHVAAVRDRRVERHHVGDDGRPRRAVAHAGGDRRGGRLPPGGGPHPARVREEEATGSSRPGTPRPVTDPGRQAIAFEDAPAELLAHEPGAAGCCIPATRWHGFDDIADDWCMLDPIKVSILAPGMGDGRQAREDRRARRRSSTPTSTASASCRRASPTSR